MTVTRLPLPPAPLPDMAPCTGLWDLFDSRRREDHWKARQICKDCPLVDRCEPPTRIVGPPLPGRPSTGSTASADGTWGGRLYQDGRVVDSSLHLSGVEACPTCGATVTQPCTTRTGHTTMDHKDRHTPRMCNRCGQAPAIRRGLYCPPCRATNDQDAKNHYSIRYRAQGAA